MPEHVTCFLSIVESLRFVMLGRRMDIGDWVGEVDAWGEVIGVVVRRRGGTKLSLQDGADQGRLDG